MGSLINGTVVEVLNLEKIFVNYFAGSMAIFFFIMMAVLAYLAARFRMPNQITLMMAALFVVMMANWFSLLYIVVILLGGLMFYYALSKIIKA